MKFKGIIISFAILLLSACSNPNLDRWRVLEDKNNSRISLTLNSYDLIRNEAKLYQETDGWHEMSSWNSRDSSSEFYARIYVGVFHRGVLMQSGVETLEQIVFDISNDAYVEFGAQQRVKTRQGFFEYQIFSLSKIPCLLVQSYWSDRSFGGVDIVRNTDPNDKIAGNHFLQGYVCDDQLDVIDSKFISNFLSGIHLSGAHWPEDRFYDHAELQRLKAEEPRKSWDVDTPNETKPKVPQ